MDLFLTIDRQVAVGVGPPSHGYPTLESILVARTVDRARQLVPSYRRSPIID